MKHKKTNIILGLFFCGFTFLIVQPLKAQTPSFDDYIQSDEKDDNYFTIKKKYHGKGIPLSYVRKMARPSVSEKALTGNQHFPTA